MALLSFAACLYLPWWSIAIVCCMVALLIQQKPVLAFLCGFLSLFILWGGLSFWISNNNEHLLAHKISLLIIQKDDPFLLILITGLIGAFVGAFAALAGSLARPRKKINAVQSTF